MARAVDLRRKLVHLLIADVLRVVQLREQLVDALLRFAVAHHERELVLFGQGLLEPCALGGVLGDPALLFGARLGEHRFELAAFGARPLELGLQFRNLRREAVLEDGEIDLLAEVLFDRDRFDPLGARDVAQREDHRRDAVGVVEQWHALHEDRALDASEVQERALERSGLSGREAIRERFPRLSMGRRDALSHERAEHGREARRTEQLLCGLVHRQQRTVESNAHQTRRLRLNQPPEMCRFDARFEGRHRHDQIETLYDFRCNFNVPK